VGKRICSGKDAVEGGVRPTRNEELVCIQHQQIVCDPLGHVQTRIGLKDLHDEEIPLHSTEGESRLISIYIQVLHISILTLRDDTKNAVLDIAAKDVNQ